MSRLNAFHKVLLFAALTALLTGGCSLMRQATRGSEASNLPATGNPDPLNGEQIYFTRSSGRGTSITYRGGPRFGGMMMMGNALTCSACHGPDGRGGAHWMHMQAMNAPDITFAALVTEEHEESEGHTEYNLQVFHQAVVEGRHPDGDALSRDMPRWQISDADLADLLAFLKLLSD
jgi:hypothetical protein